MWIRTIDGHLINAEAFHRIVIREVHDGNIHPTNGMVMAVLTREEGEDTVVIYRGELEGCVRVHDRLTESLDAILV